MWLRFVRAFEWRPPERQGHTLIVFRPGRVVFARKLCAAAALAAGAAVAVPRPADRG